MTIQTPAQYATTTRNNAMAIRNRLLTLSALVARSTASAPADMTMAEIDREFCRMREAASDAVEFLEGLR